MKEATVRSIPKYKPQIVKKQSKTQHKWNPDIPAAIRECRKSWGDWKSARKPGMNTATDYHLRMKSAKAKLRKLIRECDAKERETKMRKIVNHESNSKSFHALVRSRNPQTTTLCVDGSSFGSHEEICTGWQKHFEDLSTPKQNAISDHQY